MSLSSTTTMFIGSFSSKNVGRRREIKIVTVPGHVTVANLVIRCTGHFIGSVYCTDAQGGPWNHPPEVDVLERGPAYNHLPNPLLQNWIQALIAPFYTIPLVWFQDYYIRLHYPNVIFKYRKKFNPRYPYRRRKSVYFRELSMTTQVQVATVALNVQH